MVKAMFFSENRGHCHRSPDALLRPTLVVPELGGQGLGAWFLRSVWQPNMWFNDDLPLVNGGLMVTIGGFMMFYGD